MRRFLLLVSFTTLILGAVPACNPGGAGDDDDGTTPGWTPLVTGSWTLAPHSEDTSDVHIVTIDRTIYVGAIRQIAPPGTHHTVLYRNSLSGMIYATGLGVGELHFPPGVGLKLVPGDIVGLQLHIFNAGDTELSGTSGVEIIEVPAADVVNEADILLAGPMSLSLDPGAQSTAASTCTFSQAQTIFTLTPHMHQLGTHFKTTLSVGGTTVALHDSAYNFQEQRLYTFDPIAMGAGDSITTECTWFNTGTAPVTWGESSTEEMCFSIVYRYPALGDTYCP